MINYSQPEPNPMPNDNPSIHDLVIQDIADRKLFGFNKYGTYLQSGNGRKTAVDLHQELLDAVVYSRCLIEDQNAIIKALLLLVKQHLRFCDPDLVSHWSISANENAIDLLESLGYLKYVSNECYEFTDKSIQLIED